MSRPVDHWHAYAESHAGDIGRGSWGRLQIAPDIAGAIPEPEPVEPDPPPDDDSATQHLAWAVGNLDQAAQYAAQAHTLAKTPAQIVAIEQVAYWHGNVRIELEAVRARLDHPPPAPPTPQPPPVPPPTPTPGPITDCFGGTYGPEHGAALDLYPGGDRPGALHHGVPLYCPAACTVERYAIMVGMSGTLELSRSHGTDEDLHLPLHPEWLQHYAHRIDLLAASPMYICVVTPNSPAVIDGQRIVRFWYGHVQDGFATGARKAGDLLALTGNSGIASLPGEASHVHCCASGDGQLTPNGSLPGLLAAKWIGFSPRVTYVPGPQQYLSQMYYRGKLRGQG